MSTALTTIEMTKREKLDARLLWFDASQSPGLLVRAIHAGYNGVLLTPELLEQFETILTDRVTKIIHVTSCQQAEALKRRSDFSSLVLASSDKDLLRSLVLGGIITAYRAFVDDAQSLHDAIHVGCEHAYVLMSFKDPTNIPLELVIASLQSSRTILIKEIAKDATEDAIVTLGVMEVGAEGVLFTPGNHASMDLFLDKWTHGNHQTVALQVGEIVSARPIGMGYRSCIDLTTLFDPTEGMLVGSTSHGGVFCCPEVFHLPYMELRPFRVNAGAVHSYVYNMDNRTDYMTELRAGSPVMVVNANGQVRRAYVGRVKTEVRPLRLIEVAFPDAHNVNILMQDDWHVRIYSDDVKPLNITELKKGTKVLGNVGQAGRHVGIKVSEHILES